MAMELDLSSVNVSLRFRYQSIFASNISATEVGTPVESGLLSPNQGGYLSEVDFESTLVDVDPYGDEEANPTTRPERVAAVEISPHGDVILELRFKRGQARFRVSSQVLCLASPVFRAMLGPHSSFREACELRTHTANAAEPYVLPLEDDDPEALAIVLFALHLQNAKLPTFIKEKRTIWNMAIICDKYDCTAAFSVWVDGWADGWRRRAFRNSGHGLWLFISWTFGLGDVFTFISKKLILEGYYQAEGGKFLSKEGWNLDGLAIPAPVMETILNIRRAAITAMIEDVLAVLNKFLTGGSGSSGDGKPLCTAAVPLEDCDLMILGALTRECQVRLGLYPDHSKFLLMSVRDVHERLRSIKPRSVGADSLRGGSHGSTCYYDFYLLHNRLDRVLAGIGGLELADFASRQGLPIRRVETGAGRSPAQDEVYTPSLTLIKKLFYPRRRQPSSAHLV
ncbi:hypothetical protein DFP73DRAFT_552675 [Morchella snyderi]|nr:hypothetical protein DFP73DRAFT_552675 [Morchella snyderi]